MVMIEVSNTSEPMNTLFSFESDVIPRVGDEIVHLGDGVWSVDCVQHFVGGGQHRGALAVCVQVVP